MVLLRVLVTKRQRRGSVFAPIHWTAQVAGRSRVDSVVAGHVDPVSGQPELKATPVADVVVFTEALTVVGGEDDEGGIAQRQLIEGGEHLADVMVGVGDFRVV